MSTNRRRDLRFVLGALGLTAVVPTLLAALAPFGEQRQSFGVALGWGAALLIMVPSYLLLVRSVDATEPQRFLRAFMLGTLLRLVLTVTAVLVFATQVDQAPVRAFVLAFFLGYMLLTALELLLAVRRGARATGGEVRA